MKVILLFILLYQAPAAFAHSVSDSHGALSNQLHTFLSLHHLPMLLLLAVGIASLLAGRTRNGRKPR